jgi:DNA-directed RNA polymerase subunit beta
LTSLSWELSRLKVLYIDNVNFSDQIRNTLLLDKTNSTEEALIKIFERLRPGEPPTIEAAEQLFNSDFSLMKLNTTYLKLVV